MQKEREGDYRKQGRNDTDEVVICPTCTRGVRVENPERAVCRACDTSFAPSEAATMLEDNARRALVRSLEALPERRGLSVREGLIGSAAFVGMTALAAFLFGMTGLAVAGIALALLVIGAKAMAGGRYPN